MLTAARLRQGRTSTAIPTSSLLLDSNVGSTSMALRVPTTDLDSPWAVRALLTMTASFFTFNVMVVIKGVCLMASHFQPKRDTSKCTKKVNPLNH